MKPFLLCVLLLTPVVLPAPEPARVFPVANQFITLSANGKYLVNSFTRKPVYLTGEDGFLLAIQISDAAVETYLRDRAAKGFNFVWVGLIDSDQRSPVKNFAGNLPFNGPALTNFNEPYWAHIDDVVRQAQSYGITLGLGVAFVGAGGVYQTDINKSSDALLRAYGTFLGNRYKDFPNVIWVLGGDADPKLVNYKKLNQIGAGIVEADPNHLITLEAIRWANPRDQSTLIAYGGKPPNFVNLNWVYNKKSTVVQGCQSAYRSSRTSLPPMMGEDWYEMEHSMDGFQERQEGYWSTLSGCYLGRLFGNGPIWSFNSQNGGFASGPPWQTQLDSVGSLSHQYQGKLMDSREHWLMEPDLDRSVLKAGFGAGDNLSVAARTSDGQTIIVYCSDGNATTKTVDMSQIISKSETVEAWWFDPRTGVATFIGTFPNAGTRNFDAPDKNDWVLVLDDASANLPPPGRVYSGGSERGSNGHSNKRKR